MRTQLRLTANLFGIPLSIAGLAQVWTAAHGASVVPMWPADVLWILTAVLWLVVTVAYLYNVVATGRLHTELLDPTFSPFISIMVIVPMMLGVALAEHQHTSGDVLFHIGLVLTVVLGAWLSGQWIVSDLRLDQWHPGYFLPTVAGGLVAAGSAASLGHESIARLMFGYGMICWFALGSILLLRLFTGPRLATPLLPTMAIEVAPAVVAGSAWFALNGGVADPVAYSLAGYAILMIGVQLRLIPLYRQVPFGPGWWAFGFSYAAAFTVAVRWLGATDNPHTEVLTTVLLATVSAAIGTLVVRTGLRMAKRDFLPRAPAQPPASA
jgi:tellurite resistance protein